MTRFEDIVRKALTEGDTLSGTERERMRTMLSEYAAFKPVRTPVRRSPLRTLRMHPVFASAFVLLLLVTSTGGAAYAAEGALPGDILYPVKVEVTEPVVTALTRGDRAQVAWQFAIAKRRLSEAAALRREGRLASSTEVTLVSLAADATLKSATLASALPQPATTTSIGAAANASTTEEDLVTASRLLLEARRLKGSDDKGASKAFRASIRAAARMHVLQQAAGTLQLDDEETISAPDNTGPNTQATSTDQGAAVINSVTNTEYMRDRWGEKEDDSTHTSASTTIKLPDL